MTVVNIHYIVFARQKQVTELFSPKKQSPGSFGDCLLSLCRISFHSFRD